MSSGGESVTVNGVDAPMAIGGNRLTWLDLPHWLRREIEAGAGSPAVAARSQPGGFSPGLASVLSLADGRRVFAKAVCAAHNPDTPDLHRREARILAALPTTVPAPRLRWSYDDGQWVVLLTDAIEGVTPHQPWRHAELATFVGAAAALADQLTPSPVEAPTIQEHFQTAFTGWRQLASEPSAAERLDPWARRHLHRLAALEPAWPDAAAGTSLVHGDLRADNVLLTGAGMVVVDWPDACIGAGWLDFLCALPSIVMHGGGDPELLLANHPPARDADPAAVTAVLVALTGLFVHSSQQPPPPGIPQVRRFQQAQGAVALRWLRQRLGQTWGG